MPNTKDLFFQNYLNNPGSKIGYNLLSILLFPIALIYGISMKVRRWFYKCGLFKSYRLDHPVVSVGNLTTGGTGKTPFEMYLIELCRELNLKPLILSRGYGSETEQAQVVIGTENKSISNLPDEISMIAARYPDIPIAFGRDRYAAYQKARQSFKFDIVILDDGFQHLKIKRDLDIVILDSVQPYGAGRVIPSGNLREFKSSLKQADIIAHNYKFRKISESAVKHDLEVNFELAEIVNYQTGQVIGADKLTSQPCGLLTAIGDPGSFKRMLDDSGIEIQSEFLYRDHHKFTSDDLAEVQKICIEQNIQSLVCTEKDAVKLAKICFEKPDIYIIKIHLKPVGEDRILKLRFESLAQGT